MLIDGTNGDDTLNSSTADDTINGGLGSDTAVFNDDFANYSVTFDNATALWTVEHLNEGADGTDTLTDIEYLQFADQTVSIHSTDVEFTSGVEDQVNSENDGSQILQQMASLADGGYVITWQSNDAGSDGYDIYGQRYDAAGQKVGIEFPVNTTTTNTQEYVKVTGLQDGGFVVTWQSLFQDGDLMGVYGQRYDASGVVVGGEFLINTETTNYQKYPSVTGLEGGGFVVTWCSKDQDSSAWGVYGQRYDASGVVVGGEFLINSYTAASQHSPEVASLPGGGFVVTWQSQGQDGDTYGVYGQRYNGSGVKLGGEFQVNSETASLQQAMVIESFADGSFVIIWESTNQDGSGVGIYGQRFDTSGVVVGSEFRVNTETAYDQRYAAVTALSGGGFVVAWRSYREDDSGTIVGQEFASDGTMLGSEFLINDLVDNSPQTPAITALENGGYVVSWKTWQQDGDGYGIASKSFSSLHGTTGNDIINGSETHDTIYAQAGNDQLIGGTGNDTLDGGSGADMAIYSGNRADYDLIIEDGQFLVRHILSEETDQLVSIETVRFADEEVSLVGTDFPTLLEQTLQLDNSEGGIGYLLGSDDETATSNLVFSDVEGEGPTNGAVTIDADGSFVYTADAGYTGSDSFKYRVTDADGFVRIATMMVEVSDVEFTSGIENVVNSYDTSDQAYPAITKLSDGGYVIVWESFGQDGSEDGIYGQRYDVSGNTVGLEFDINSYTASGQAVPSVTGLTNGGFVVVWNSIYQDGSNWSTYGRMYHADGTRNGAEFQVSTTSLLSQWQTVVEGLPDGGFVAVWQGDGQDGDRYGIYSQHFSSTGAKIGGEIQVNSYTTNHQQNPAITLLANGSYVITWRSMGADGDDFGVYGQRFSSVGTALGSEFLINSTTEDMQYHSQVTQLSDGGFIVVWDSEGQDGDLSGCYGQRFDGDANRIGGEFQIATTTASTQSFPFATGLAGGGFVVIWRSYDQDGSSGGIIGQEFAADGGKLGSEFLVNDFTSSNQDRPDVTALENGGYVVTWHSYGNDGDGYGIASKSFSSLHGTAGNDIINGSETHDTIYAQAGNDQLIGGTGNDTLDGGAGADILFGGTGADVLSGGGGDDVIIVDDNDVFDLDGSPQDIGGSGYDTAILEEGATVSPTDWADHNIEAVIGNAEDNVIHGGDDSVDFTFDGGAGNDVLSSAGGADLLIGGAGDDSIFGGAGNDTIDGGAGNDTLDGGLGADSIFGGGGDDLITIADDDSLQIDGVARDIGGEGYDTAVLADGTIWDTGNWSWYGFEGVIGNAENNIIVGGENTVGYTFDGGAGDDVLLSAGGNDLLTGGSGVDTINGGAGNDTIDGGSGADSVFGGAGDDVITLSDDDYLQIDGVARDIGGEGYDTAILADGAIWNTSNWSWYGFEHVIGNEQDNIIMGGEPTVDYTFEGGSGSDLLQSSGGADLLDGGSDNDTLSGNGGNDTLDGGSGSDTAIFNDAFANYDFTYNIGDASWTVEHLNGGADGTDLIRNVENFQFSDQTISTDISAIPAVDQGVLDQQVDEDATFNFVLPVDAFSDVNPLDELTYDATLSNGDPLPSWLTFDGTTFGGVPLNEDVGDLTLTVGATDRAGQVVTTDFTLTVNNTNDAPTVDEGLMDQGATEDAAFSYALPSDAFADEDLGDSLTYTATLVGGAALPGWLTFDGTTFSGTPLNGDVGDIDVEVTATDTSGATETTSFNLNVSDNNEAPTVDQGIVDESATEDVAYSFTLPSDAFSDVDLGDSLTYTATLVGGAALPSWLSFDGTTFNGTPLNGDVGDIDVEVTATDTSGATVASNFNVDVSNTNDDPTVDQGMDDQLAETNFVFSYTIPFDAFEDVDVGDDLSYTATMIDGSPLPSWLSLSGATFSGTPVATDMDEFEVVVTATDNVGAVVHSNFTLIVDSAPAQTTGVVIMGVNDVANGILSGADNDTSHEGLIFELITGPENGEVIVSEDGSYTFTPDNNVAGEDRFIYRITDVNGLISFGQMDVDIYPGIVGNDAEEVWVNPGSPATVNRNVASAGLENGGYVVMWPYGSSLLSQLYGSDGEKIGGEVIVNQISDGSEHPVVSGLSNGGYVVIWRGTLSEGDTNDHYAFIRQYSAAGLPVGEEFIATGPHQNSYFSNHVDIIGLSDGGYLATWSVRGMVGDDSYNGVAAQRFDTNGVQVGDEFIVNTITDNSQDQPEITEFENGDILFVWRSYDYGDSRSGISGQRYNSQGNQLGEEFTISAPSNTAHSPEVAALKNGNFIVTWLGEGVKSYSIADVWGQVYDASGNLLRSKFQISDRYITTIRRSSVVALEDGGFVVVWESASFNAGTIAARVYDASGIATTEAFQINSFLDGSEGVPSVAALAGGGFVVSWNNTERPDGSFGQAIYKKVYSGETLTAMALEGSEGNDVLIGSEADEILISGAGEDVLDGGAGDDTLTGGLGDDTLTGGDGADTYEFTRGDGEDVIHDTSADGSTDTLNLGSINHDQLWFEQSGDDLLISIIGESDQITVDDWYISSDHKVEVIEASDGQSLDVSGVEALVNAMATFSAPGAGETDLSDASYTDLQDDLAANWQSS